MLVDAPTTARFTRWFSQRIGADVRIERASTPGTGGGWSNETMILDLSRLGRVVVRLQPSGPSMFRTYELAREYTILEILSARGQPKVPKPLAIDQHGTVAGRPLFVMSYVPGRVPSVTVKSWLASLRSTFSFTASPGLCLERRARNSSVLVTFSPLSERI